MPKKSRSALHHLLVSLRRVIVLLVAAFALALDWPLHIVAIRVGILWAVLALLSQAAEVLLQYLAHRAQTRAQVAGHPSTAGGSAP